MNMLPLAQNVELLAQSQYFPIGTIKPVCSAIGINSSGVILPGLGYATEVRLLHQPSCHF